MPKIILISGKKRSGKDTFATYLIEAINELNEGLPKPITTYHTSFAKALKVGAAADFRLIELYLNDIAKDLLLIDNVSLETTEALKQIETKLTLNFAEFENNKNVLQRLFWQIYGTEIFRNRHSQNYWTCRAFQDCIGSGADVSIVSDARFPNEVTDTNMYFCDEDIFPIRIQRDEADRMSDSHVSETALDNYEFDIVIPNNSTLDELKLLANSYANKIVRTFI